MAEPKRRTATIAARCSGDSFSILDTSWRASSLAAARCSGSHDSQIGSAGGTPRTVMDRARRSRRHRDTAAFRAIVWIHVVTLACPRNVPAHFQRVRNTSWTTSSASAEQDTTRVTTDRTLRRCRRINSRSASSLPSVIDSRRDSSEVSTHTSVSKRGSRTIGCDVINVELWRISAVSSPAHWQWSTNVTLMGRLR